MLVEDGVEASSTLCACRDGSGGARCPARPAQARGAGTAAARERDRAGFLVGRGSRAHPPDEAAEVAGHLQTLVRKELIRPDHRTFAGEDGFRFGHILVRDAAYESMPKVLRG